MAADAPTTLATAARAVTPEEASGLLRSEYGIDGSLTRMIGERDQNFAVKTTAGDFALKIIHPAELRVVTDFQSRILLELAANDPALPVQRIVPTRSGANEAQIALDDGTRRAARLTSFLPGLVASTVPPSAARGRRKGELLARTQLALQDFSHPAAEHHVAWDVAHTLRQRAAVGEIDDPDHRALMAAALDRFERDVHPAQASYRRQVVHNDLSPDNLVLQPGNPDVITGLLDFGDATLTAAVHDLAIAIAYELSDLDDPIAATLPLLEGFASLKRLDTAEIAHLLDLVIGRLIVRVGITEWRAKRFPENRGYILRRTPVAWLFLDRLMRLPRDQVTVTFWRASGAA